MGTPPLEGTVVQAEQSRAEQSKAKYSKVQVQSKSKVFIMKGETKIKRNSSLSGGRQGKEGQVSKETGE